LQPLAWGNRVVGEICNLLAAILCTVGAAIGAVAMFLSEPTFVNQLAALGSAIGAVGGIAWIVAAAVAVRERL
jgi:hypothetical protein